MPKKAPEADFRFSMQELIDLSNEKKAFIARDTPEFNAYGVTAATIAAFTAKITKLDTMVTDDEMRGDQQTATEAKDALAAAVRKAIRGIMTRAENKYGLNTGRYNSFGTKGLADMTDTELTKCAHTVVRVATKRLAELATEGLAIADITALATLTDNFYTALGAQADAIANRDIATEDRVEAANDLYNTLVKLCNSGKDLWSDTNEAKYNDYVLGDSPKPKPEPPAPAPGA